MTLRLIRKRLSEREGSPPNTRVNPETGEVETSMDDGVTWTPDPNSDPRLNPAMQYPPNTAPDPPCAAAAGMVENCRRVFEVGATGTSVAGIATALIGLLLIPGVGWMFYVFLIAAGAIVAAGAVALRDAFTETVYEWLLCAFLDELDADGRITQAGLDNVLTASSGQGFSSLVPTGLDIVFKMHGVVGFNNAGSVYADPDAVCPCSSWCYFIDLELAEGGFTVNGTSGAYTPSVGWEAADVVIGVSRTLLSGAFVFGEDVFINTIDVVYDYHKATSVPGTEGVGVWSYDFANPLYSVDQNVAEDGDDLSINITSGIPQPVTGLSFWMQPAYNATGGSAILKLVQVAGSGEAPEWFELNGWTEC